MKTSNEVTKANRRANIVLLIIMVGVSLALFFIMKTLWVF